MDASVPLARHCHWLKLPAEHVPKRDAEFRKAAVATDPDQQQESPVEIISPLASEDLLRTATRTPHLHLSALLDQSRRRRHVVRTDLFTNIGTEKGLRTKIRGETKHPDLQQKLTDRELFQGSSRPGDSRPAARSRRIRRRRHSLQNKMPVQSSPTLVTLDAAFMKSPVLRGKRAT